jgi:hypothetical protein
MAETKTTRKRNPKAKGSGTATKAAEKETDIKKMLNKPTEVVLSFGTFEVRDLDVYTIISILSEGLEVYVELSEGKSPLEMLRRLGKDEELRLQISKMFAIICGSDDPEPFMKIKPKDFAVLIKTINEVVDFDEIKEAFFVMGLEKYLPTTPTSTETMTEKLQQV